MDVPVCCDDASREPSAEGARTSRVRRPYRAPKLRALGSVRELTLGSAAGMIEGAGTFRSGM